MRVRRCRFCRKSEGDDLVYQPAEEGYRPGRRNYRQVGFGPSYYHAECLAEFEHFEAASKARYSAEREQIIAALAISMRSPK